MGNLHVFALAVFAAHGLSAAQFQFGTMVRAGLSGNQEWEIAAGQSSGALPPSATTGQVSPHYTDGRNNPFEIGYVKSTNTATLTVRTGSGGGGSSTTTVNWNPVGGSLLPAAATWTIPMGGLYVSAARVPIATSISLDKLKLTGAISILQPIQQTTMTAAQNNTPGGVVVRQSADIVFRTTGSGDWKLEGEFTMTGLAPNGAQPGAKRSELQFGFNVIAEAPEPATVLATALGLGALIALRRRQGEGTKVSAGRSSAITGLTIEGPQS